jgi:hypothetical protein
MEMTDPPSAAAQTAKTAGMWLREAWYFVRGYTIEAQIAEQRKALTTAKRRAERDLGSATRAASLAKARCRVAIQRGQGAMLATQYARSAVAAQRREVGLVRDIGDLDLMDGELSRVHSDMAATLALRNVTLLLERFSLRYGSSTDTRHMVVSYGREANLQLMNRELRQETVADVADEAEGAADAGDNEQADAMVQGYMDQLELAQAEKLSHTAPAMVRLRHVPSEASQTFIDPPPGDD